MKTKNIFYKNTENQKKLIEEYLSGISTVKLSEQYNVNSSTIRGYLIRNNIKLRSNTLNSRKYILRDKNIFNQIDSHEKAYFLGLLYADGSYCKTVKTVSISLMEEDKYVLEYLNKLLFVNKHLYKINPRNGLSKKIQYKLVISDKEISKDLYKFGITENKTNKSFLPNIDKKFLCSFILGVFDGDGSVYKSKTVKRNCSFNIAGNLSLLTEIQNELMDKCGLSKTKMPEHRNIFYLIYSGKNNIRKIYNYLYSANNSIFMRRKKNKFNSILEN